MDHNRGTHTERCGVRVPTSHAFSVDVEDWYQGVGIPYETWHTYEPRLERSMGTLLDLMGRHDVKATCFVLGRVAQDHPALVQRMHREGHEVATHGQTHTEVTRLTPAAFRTEIRDSKARLEDLIGEPVLGFRAPYFTITAETLWALEVLVEEGIRYDSSIHPIRHDRCGIPDARRTPHRLHTPAGPIVELPVATLPLVRGLNVPVGGGGYLRLYPYWVWHHMLRRLEQRGERFGLYIHPWELDAEQPRIEMAPRFARVHYLNLNTTYDKLDRLFGRFSFDTYRATYRAYLSEPDPHPAYP